MSNNVKVNVRFTCERDDNLDLLSMKAHISYCLPEEIGLKKTRQLDLVVIEDSTYVEFVKKSQHLMVAQRIKGVIHNAIKENIMERLYKAYENNTDAIANIMNMFNQMKFDFHFDVAEAEKIVMSERKAFGKTSRSCRI